MVNVDQETVRTPRAWQAIIDDETWTIAAKRLEAEIAERTRQQAVVGIVASRTKRGAVHPTYEKRFGVEIASAVAAIRSELRTEAYISNVENGFAVPSLTTVLRLAVALDCKVTALTSVFDKVDVSAILPK